MTKNDNRTDPGTKQPDMNERIDGLLAEVFYRRDVARLESLEQASDALTEEEHQECGETLEQDEGLVERITSMPMEVADEGDTLRGSSDETVAEPGSAFYDDANRRELDRMQESVETFEQQETVSIQSTFRKTAELGRGGQGVVYLAEGEDEFSASCALKVFSPGGYESPDAFEADMDRLKKVASRIHREPHDDLVDIGWFGLLEGVYAMLMRHIDGCDLRQLLRPRVLKELKASVTPQRWEMINKVVYSVHNSQQLALKPAIAVYITERLLRGVEALHVRNIIHGDIKPSNIMLNASGSVKIIDIGSAFQIGSPPAAHHVTPAYAAPEFLGKGTLSEQSDLASVGYVLIEMLSGQPIADVGPGDPDESMRTIDKQTSGKLLEEKKALSDRLEDILPKNIVASRHLLELCRRLIDPDLKQRFPAPRTASWILKEERTNSTRTSFCRIWACVISTRLANGWRTSNWLRSGRGRRVEAWGRHRRSTPSRRRRLEPHEAGAYDGWALNDGP